MKSVAQMGWRRIRSFIFGFKENGLKKTIENLKVQYHLTDEQVSENTAVLGFLGASSSETFNWLYPLVAVCLVIILAAGVLMVSGCMNSNVAQRTKFWYDALHRGKPTADFTFRKI